MKRRLSCALWAAFDKIIQAAAIKAIPVLIKTPATRLGNDSPVSALLPIAGTAFL